MVSARCAASWVVSAFLITGATEAHADPCKAIPSRGPMPAYLRHGARFSGPVVYVGDGDSLCVAVGPGHGNWVEVRLADFYAPELHDPEGAAAKAALQRVAMGREADCTADHRSYDRVVAVCRIRGVSIGARLKAEGDPEGGRGFARR